MYVFNGTTDYFSPCPCSRVAIFVDSLAFVDARDWDSYRREQELITGRVDKMKTRTAYYGTYQVSFSTL